MGSRDPTVAELRTEQLNMLISRFKNLQNKKKNDRLSGTMLKTIQGIRCFIKYKLFEDPEDS